jgi:hypothetical protein
MASTGEGALLDSIAGSVLVVQARAGTLHACIYLHVYTCMHLLAL